MPRETHTTDGGAITSTWTCRRCGWAYPKDELVDDLCEECIDDDEWGDEGSGPQE